VRYEFEINGRVRTIVVRRVGPKVVAQLDGRDWDVDADWVGPHTLSLILEEAPGSRRAFDVSMAPRAAGGLTVWIGGMPIAVGVSGGRRVRPPDVHTGDGPQRVVAPMPGKIVRVAVKPGEPVRARQRLVVIEAMKMENELRAVKDGTVTELHAQEGMSVEAGALLVVVQ
jgi:biotin carboxyl carrier protein